MYINLRNALGLYIYIYISINLQTVSSFSNYPETRDMDVYTKMTDGRGAESERSCANIHQGAAVVASMPRLGWVMLKHIRMKYMPRSSA